MTGLADFDGFIIFIQDCVWVGYPTPDKVQEFIMICSGSICNTFHLCRATNANLEYSPSNSACAAAGD